MNTQEFPQNCLVRDNASGEHGKVLRTVTGSVAVWLMESDTTVWRDNPSEELTKIDALQYDQACFEWELNANNS
jgi:hypothetical protein